MKTTIDQDSWPRKNLFDFFNSFEEPYFGVTTSIDCTVAYQKAKERQISFFLYYLHKSLAAVNSVEEFLLRIEKDTVVKYDNVHASPTVPRKDGSFGFAYMKYQERFEDFYKEAAEEVERVSREKSLTPAIDNENVIHYSTLPWINFTSVSHARKYSRPDSVPKITFGKVYEENGKKFMSMSVHVNHALADAYHVGKYIDLFQSMMK